MAKLTVEGIPPALLARLAETAAANGRCLNNEVILSLVRHLGAQPRRPPREESVRCPFGSWVRPGGRAHDNVAWGEPR